MGAGGRRGKVKHNFKNNLWCIQGLRKEKEKAFYPPWVKMEQDSHNPLFFYSVLSISKILLEKQGEKRLSMDMYLLKIFLFLFAIVKFVVSSCKQYTISFSLFLRLALYLLSSKISFQQVQGILFT